MYIRPRGTAALCAPPAETNDEKWLHFNTQDGNCTVCVLVFLDKIWRQCKELKDHKVVLEALMLLSHLQLWYLEGPFF